MQSNRIDLEKNLDSILIQQIEQEIEHKKEKIQKLEKIIEKLEQQMKKYMIAIKQTYEKIDNLSERNKLLIGIVSEIKQENDK